MERDNIECVPASEYENYAKHVDFWIKPKDKFLGVDVKGLKKPHAEGYIVVEFNNVQGRAGWCSEEAKADLIAFLFKDGFHVIPRMSLLLYCRTLWPMEPYNGKFDAKKIWHKTYSRKGRKDLMTVVEVDEIKSLD